MKTEIKAFVYIEPLYKSDLEQFLCRRAAIKPKPLESIIKSNRVYHKYLIRETGTDFSRYVFVDQEASQKFMIKFHSGEVDVKNISFTLI
jgi:hypothetical protein